MRAAFRLVITFCLLLAAAPAMATPILEFTPNPVSVNAGDTFTVDIAGTGFFDLYTYQFDVTFSPTVLEALDITEGPFLTSTGEATFFIPGSIDNGSGEILFTGNSLVGAISGLTGGGVLATIQFRALTSGTASITAGNFLLLDSLGGEETPPPIAGEIRVSDAGAAPVPEPGSMVLLASGVGLLVARARSKQGRHDSLS